METTIQEAYAIACRTIGEQVVQMQFMGKALADAQQREKELLAKLDAKAVAPA